ncbi:protein SIEVE ELEMENT OCCLUSION B-like [Syzygium oleosum]|uniref:protein SIEVE ELEMENT OCCLUSION B-like n=1 Tax=Syzygium oleosum TaxID=219896 RepID=UPI0024BA5B9B|nr:protein SIEVE ELEMENT OCCLUSION B-like [Syzygium oleosum]
MADHNLIRDLVGLLDDDKFMNTALKTHAPNEEDFDDRSLFVLVENVLNAATMIVDAFLNPNMDTEAQQIKNAYPPPTEHFIPPISIINEVCCQITCKALETNDVHRTTESLFGELSHFSWVAKAVVTLSALAVFYADFWQAAQSQPSGSLLNSVAVLKGFPAITQKLETWKNQMFLTLNDLIKMALNMTKCIVDFKHNSKDIPELCTAINVSTIACQITVVVLVCSVQFTSIINMSYKYQQSLDLDKFTRKVRMTENFIKKQFKDFEQKKEEIREYQRLKKLLVNPTKNVELIKALFDIRSEPEPLCLGPKKAKVSIEAALGGKSMLLLISDLKLENNELVELNNIYNARGFKESNYEIVWIPILEQVTPASLTQFSEKQKQMPWLSPSNPKSISNVIIRIVKEEWNFRKDSIAVVLNPQGKVENKNAMPMIRVWGFEAFPFTESSGWNLWSRQEINWLELLLKGDFPKIQEFIKNEKLIFFLYGGEDGDTVQKIEDCLKKIRKDGIPMEFINANEIKSFYARLEICMLSKMQTKADVHDSLMRDLLNLYTHYKKNRGFTIACVGSRVLVNTSLATASEVLFKVRIDLEEEREGDGNGLRDRFQRVLRQCI